ncbi:chromate efflux transporter [Nannocystis pusilla]|uniref:Chromate efflux transporter n=1 Tax=Nannocystis pusilla TaxID=889268 RepID=A0ABS7TIT9_9BACT|nr:chromate efflux transporter [Nannocystis pusilla]MBZ5708140.1 chromate efflux transporter [Nannocystis pusilla]
MAADSETQLDPSPPPASARPGELAAATSLLELGVLFARLGVTAFGGPAAHIAMMQDEVVNRRKWLTEARFLDLLGATNLIPGPNSTEMAIHIGWERRRWAGLAVAGLAFIVPATAITGVFAWAYVRFGAVPAVGWLLYGVKPVILGVVVQALLGLAPRAARTTGLRVLAGAAALLVVLGAHEVAVLFAAGVAALVASTAARGRSAGPASLILPLAPAVATGVAHGVTLPGLFAVFAKTGAVLFGSGYVLLAFLRADLVERLGWLTEAQLLDAVAVGQITPGPVFTTATFIGYVLAGASGALVATAGIFLPAFVFVALSGPLVPRLRASPASAAFLDGVNVASLALMAVVTLELGRAALVDVPSAGLAVASGLLLVRFKVNSTWLILGGAAAGWALHAAN